MSSTALFRALCVKGGTHPFFHVNLEDLEAFVKGKGLKIEFTKLAEAKEYRKTVAFRQEQEAKSLPEPDQFPSDLFATTTG